MLLKSKLRSFFMNNVVVTGAAGFVGSALVKECLKHDATVYAIDIVDDPSFRLPLGNKSLFYIKNNLSSIDELFSILSEKKIDVFYHFAWNGSAGPLREDYEVQIANALLTVKLLEFAKKIGCKKFVVAGTIMEFETFEAVYSQGTKPQTAYIYGVGKSLAHQICKPIANKIGIDLVWGYITNAYGVGELSPRLINTTIRKCINKEPLNFTSASQNYDFVYIDDVANAFYLLGNKGKANKGYLIGSGDAKPLKEFLISLINVCNKKAIPSFGSVPFTGVNQNLRVFSIDDIKKDCGYAPSVSFEDGVKRTYDWLIKESH